MTRTAWLHSALLSVTAIVILGRGITVGGFRYGDAAVHAMDGVLLLDWATAGPEAWASPIDFAEQQYAHYPALGIGRHYPPLFAIVESVFFALFGVSAPTARACVVMFGAVGAWGVYALARAGGLERTAALLTGVAFLTAPAVVDWGRQTMLEVPTLAVLAWAGVAFLRYLDTPSIGRGLLAVGLAGAAVLCRQSAVFLFGAMTLALWVSVARRRAPAHHAIAMTAVTVCVTWLMVQSLTLHGVALVDGASGAASRFTGDQLAFYPLQLPYTLGWVYLVAAGGGLILAWRRSSPAALFGLAWCLCAGAMLVATSYKNERFLTVALIPLVLWCGEAWAWSAERVSRGRRPLPHPPSAGGSAVLGDRVRRTAITLIAASVLVVVVVGWRRPVPVRPDYAPIVAAHAERIRGRAILFSGLRDGDFVFAVRQHIPRREAAVVRASKLLYACSASPDIQFTSFAGTPNDVATLMRRYSFPTVVVERENRTGTREDDLLRDYLTTGGDYRRIASHNCAGEGVPARRHVALDVYELTNPPTVTPRYVDIPIPRLGETIRLDLTRFAESRDVR
jgi:hypothetical protein